MDIALFVKKMSVRLLCVMALGTTLAACDNAIYDGEGDCSVNYRIRFRYDYNMKYADAFAHEVKAVTLYLIDANGKVAWQRTEEGAALSNGEYTMTVDVEPGKYDLLAWCGTKEKGSFAIPETSEGKGLTCTLGREHDEKGTAFVDKDIDRLFYGWLPEQDFAETEGTYTYTVPLVKNTNSVRVVLQHLSGEPVDKDKFEFSISDKNGTMNWDNALLPDEPLTYYAWHTEQGTAGIGEPETAKQISSFSAAVAELTVARLMEDADTRLTVRNRNNGEVVLSIPLIDYALLVKGFYNKEMGNQEFLDRQDEYSLVFFLDEGDRWMDAYIYINSWKLVLSDVEL